MSGSIEAEDEAPLGGQRGNWAPLKPDTMYQCNSRDASEYNVTKNRNWWLRSEIFLCYTVKVNMKRETTTKCVFKVSIVFYNQLRVGGFICIASKLSQKSQMPKVFTFKASLHCFPLLCRGKWSRKDRSQQIYNAIHCCYHQSKSEGWSWKVSCCFRYC